MKFSAVVIVVGIFFLIENVHATKAMLNVWESTQRMKLEI